MKFFFSTIPVLLHDMQKSLLFELFNFLFIFPGKFYLFFLNFIVLIISSIILRLNFFNFLHHGSLVFRSQFSHNLYFLKFFIITMFESFIKCECMTGFYFCRSPATRNYNLLFPVISQVDSSRV